MNNEEKEVLSLIIDHYENSVHKIGNVVGPLITTHRDLLAANEDFKKVLLIVMRTNLESFGFIKDLKKMMEPNEVDQR